MQPPPCRGEYPKTVQRSLQRASGKQRTQALAPNALRTQALAPKVQRTAEHARRCRRTCNFFTRPRDTRSITASAQRHVVLEITYTPTGAVASRWHANATQRNMRRTRPHGEYCAKMEQRDGSACCRRRLQPGDDRWAKNRTSALMSSSARWNSARNSARDSSLPSERRESDTGLPVRRSVNLKNNGRGGIVGRGGIARSIGIKR